MAHAIPIALAVGSAALQAGGTIAAGNAQSQSLRSEASQLDQMAGQDRASAQRAAAEQHRQARLLQSRALAVGAATGGASDPTVVNTIARLSGEGQYRALTALYEGEETARSKEMQAIAKRKEANNVKTASRLSALGTVIGAGSSIYTRFGGGGPAPSGKASPTFGSGPTGNGGYSLTSSAGTGLDW